MRHPTETEINDFADGTARGETREAVARHVEECAACRGEVERTRELLEDAAGLAAEARPARDLWPGIAARIRSDGSASGAGPLPRGRTRPGTGRMWLAAAAVALVAASSAVTAWVVGGGPADPAPATVAAGGPAGSEAGVAPVGTALPAAARAVEVEYEASIDRLLRVLRERQEELSPETRTVVDRNLEVIDAALAEIRRALVDDPSSARLLRALSDGYERKLQLLRDAALAPAQL